MSGAAVYERTAKSPHGSTRYMYRNCLLIKLSQNQQYTCKCLSETQVSEVLPNMASSLLAESNVTLVCAQLLTEMYM